MHDFTANCHKLKKKYFFFKYDIIIVNYKDVTMEMIVKWSLLSGVWIVIGQWVTI